MSNQNSFKCLEKKNYSANKLESEENIILDKNEPSIILESQQDFEESDKQSLNQIVSLEQIGLSGTPNQK
jgi:hypothetical protein